MTAAPGDRAERLAAVIADMINADATITTRAIIARMPGDFRHPTDVTRPPEINSMYRNGVEQQRLVRALAEKAAKKSRPALLSTIASQAQEIETLRSEKDLLVASHRAMLAAVGEMGGWQAWLRFFQKNHDAIAALGRLRALPVDSLESTAG